MYYFLFITLSIFAIGEIIGVASKAKVSSVFVTMLLFLIGFLFDWIPDDIINQAGLTQLGAWSTGFIVFHMGTTIDINELIQEWRTIVIAVISMIVAVLTTFAISPIIGKTTAIVAIPVINGGIVATNIMAEAAMEKGLALSAAMATMLYAIQKFFGTPFASRYGLKEAEEVLTRYRAGEYVKTSSTRKVKTTKENMSFFERYSQYYGDFTCLFLISLFAYLSFVIGRATNISYSIWALFLGIIATRLGIVPKKILVHSNSSGLLNLAVFASIIPSLATIQINDLATLGFRSILVFSALLIGIYLFIGILPLWKIVGSKNLALGISVSQLLGFPATYLISEEIASAVARNEEEREIVLDLLIPKYVVAGLVTVTSLSVVMAGIFSSML